MNSSSFGLKLTVFLTAAVVIALAIGGGMYVLLAQSQTADARRTLRVIAAKNTTYQLLETLVDAQTALQQTLRLKDPDEIETSLAHYAQRREAAQQLITANADLPGIVNERLTTLVGTHQQAIDRFLVGENSAAFELMLTVAPVQFDALLRSLREHSLQVEASIAAEAAANRTQVAVILRWAAVGCTGLIVVLVVYGWSFRRSTTRHLGELAATLSDGADQVTSAAHQVSVSSQSLASGSSQQAASIEETSSSLEELSSMTKRNADSAAAAKSLSGETHAAAETGNREMGDMRRAMDAIRSSSNDISKIIKSIDEIAFQTNILALNAAVEAARAGEAGMGFAVVAEEVRNLAQRSAQSAKETASKIEVAIRNGEEGVALSEKVAHSLDVIVTKARKVDELVAEIAGASQEQSQGISQINTAVSQMDKVTQSNAAGAEESASAAEELNALAETTRSAIQRLREFVDGRRATRSVAGKLASSPQPASAALAQAPSRPGLVAPKPGRSAPTRKGAAPDLTAAIDLNFRDL